MDSQDKCYLYHICKSGDEGRLSEGYVGISIEPRARTIRHLSGLGSIVVQRALEKYGSLIIELISEGTTEQMLEMELWLRPQERIGWNIAKGGNTPPLNTGWSDTQRERILSSIPRGKDHSKWKGYWVIDGIRYESKREAAQAHNITRRTVKNRVESDKFPNWTFEPKDGYNG